MIEELRGEKIEVHKTLLSLPDKEGYVINLKIGVVSVLLAPQEVLKLAEEMHDAAMKCNADGPFRASV